MRWASRPDVSPSPTTSAPPDTSSNEDLAAARELDETLETAELFLYSGDQHLFAERGRPGYDERAATLLEQRVLGFLDTIG